MSVDLEEALERLNTQLLVNPRDPWARYNQGRMLQRLGRLEQAAAAYESALRHKPDMAEAHFHLGQCWQGRGDLERAAASFHAASAAKGEHAEALVAEADALLALGRPADAAAPLARASALAPQDLSLLLRHADTEIAAEHLAEAVTLYERARALAPQDREIQLVLARLLCQTSRWKPARELLDELAPALARREAFDLLAEACLGLGQREAAAAAYATALSLEASHLPTLAAAAALEAALGRHDTALELYARARALGPDVPGLAVGHGQALLRSQQIAAAAEAFRAELRLDGANAEAHAGLGACLRLQGQAVEALGHLERARELDTGRATTHLELTHVYRALNRTDDERVSLREVETRGADDATIWSRLGHHHLAAGDDAAALTAFERSLALQPEHADGLFQRGLLLMKLEGREQDALAALLGSRRLRPTWGPTLAAIGAIYRRLARHAEAASVLEALRERERAGGQSLDAEARAGLGDSLHELGRHADALEAFRQVLAVVPDHRASVRGAANALLALGQTREGLAELRRAVALDPAGVGLRRELAQAELAAREWDAAEKTLAGGLELSPSDGELLAMRGELLLGRARPAEAVQALERAEWVSPGNPRVRELLGEALQASGRGEDAVELLRESAARQKTPALLRRLGLLLCDLGRGEEGLAPLEQALAAGLPDGQAAEAHLRMGLVLEQRGQFEAAAQHLREATRKAPDLLDAYVHATTCYTALGAHRDAVQAARQWARLRPREVAAHLAIARSSRAAGREDEASKAYRELLAMAPDELVALRELGALELGRRDYEGAERALRAALAQAPGDRELLGQLAETLEARGQAKPLYDVLVALGEAAGTSPAHALRLARAADRAGDRRAAIAAYRRALAVEDAPAPEAERLGWLLLEAGDAEGALPWFQRAARVASAAQAGVPGAAPVPPASVSHGLARCLAQLGQWPACLEMARLACRLDPSLWQAQRLRGQGALVTQRWGEAIEAFSEVLGQQPEDGEARFGWAVACERVGRLAEARQALQLLVRQQPEHEPAWRKLAELLAADRQIEPAAQAATRAMDADTASAAAPALLGRLQFERGELDAAVAAFRIALEREAGHAAARRGLGMALLRKGDFQGAAAALADSVASEPADAEAHFALGIASEHAGSWRQALDAYKRALAAGRNDVVLFPSIARLAEQLNEAEDAVAALRQIVRQSPQDYAAHARLGTNLRQLRRPVEAMVALRQAAALKPDLPEIVFQLGLCAVEAGNLVLAREQHRRLQTLDATLGARLGEALAR